MNIRQLNDTVSITDLLAKEGFLPAHKRGSDWWYISPTRPGERTASFKVNVKINRWYDHGTGEGGKLFDLALRLYPSLNKSLVIQKLKNYFSFQQPHSPIIQRKSVRETSTGQLGFADEKKKIRVLSVGGITSPALIHYLGLRKIPVELAQAYCKEVAYELYGKQYYAIGFANDAGGYELRNPYFKGSSSPKGITFFDKGAEQVTVFEGFFSFLSFITLHQNLDLLPTNLLVLNSLSFFEKSRPLMEKHGTINLYLDRDAAGIKRTAEVVKEGSLYQDCSILYKDSKDLNHWLVQNLSRLQQKFFAINQAKNLADAMLNKQSTRNNPMGHRH